jgi:hypothetical protein
MSLSAIRQFARFYHGKPEPQPSRDDFVETGTPVFYFDERSITERSITMSPACHFKAQRRACEDAASFAQRVSRALFQSRVAVYLRKRQ